MEMYYEYTLKLRGLIIAFLLITLNLGFGEVYASASDSLLWLNNFEAAKIKAQQEDKPILIYFSGSDWCRPCIKMKQEIFESPEFKEYAAQNLICVLADFPRYKKNKLAIEQIEHNENLAERFNTEGVFPLAVLVNEKGSFIDKRYYQGGDVTAFIKFLRSYSKKRLIAYKKSFAAMGSPFEVTVVTEEKTKAEQAIQVAALEISRIEKLISSWDSLSQTSQINEQSGGRFVKTDKELFDLIARCKKISALTNGAFDISFASIEHIWKFDGSMTQIPSKEEVAASVDKINYQNIILNKEDTSLALKKQGMKIGFGAIGKGYVANRTCDLLKKMGIESGIVNAGGDLLAWGRQPSGNLWTIGIANPSQEDQVIAKLELKNTAIVTSGNYERYAIIQGKKYTHIIDPRTGYPVSGLKSVSIICPDAELADALATAVFVMGEKDGLHFINQLENVECIIINEQGKMSISNNLNLKTK